MTVFKKNNTGNQRFLKWNDWPESISNLLELASGLIFTGGSLTTFAFQHIPNLLLAHDI